MAYADENVRVLRTNHGGNLALMFWIFGAMYERNRDRVKFRQVGKRPR